MFSSGGLGAGCSSSPPCPHLASGAGSLVLVGPMARDDRAREEIDEQRSEPARPARRLRVQATPTAGASTSARRCRSASASPRTSPGPHRGGRPHRPGRLDRLPGHRDRGRGAARRAAVHQAPPAPLQHPPARRQVLSLRRGEPRRGVPARLLHPRAPPLRPVYFGPFSSAKPGARDARPARQAVPVPHLRGAGARAALRGSLPRLLHQALPGALRRLHRPRRVPAQHRGDHRLPLRPLSRRRARPGAQDGRGRRRPRSSSARRSTATAWRRSAR